jgi:hypothetical protein
MEGTGLHESAAEEDREAAVSGSAAPILDGTGGGASPTKKQLPVTGGVRYGTRVFRAQGGGKGARLVRLRRTAANAEPGSNRPQEAVAP